MINHRQIFLPVSHTTTGGFGISENYLVGHHVLGRVLGRVSPLHDKGILVARHGDLAMESVNSAGSLRLGAVLDKRASLALCKTTKQELVSICCVCSCPHTAIEFFKLTSRCLVLHDVDLLNITVRRECRPELGFGTCLCDHANEELGISTLLLALENIRKM
jgi:hypothetical protein